MHWLKKIGPVTVLAGMMCLHTARAGDGVSVKDGHSVGTTATPAIPLKAPNPPARCDGLPRKVLIGTVISGDRDIDAKPLEHRLKKMNELLDAVAAEAKAKYPGKRLDLVVLPEGLLGRAGGPMMQRSVRLDEVREQVAACARRYDSYLIVPMYLVEEEKPLRYSNAAVLVDRKGAVAGIYRKVHPVANPGSEVVENGTTPGSDFPVFDCDFGRVGIQICWDMCFNDGWDALARQGAEIVAVPTAAPQTRRPAMYALRHDYYVVSSTPFDNASLFNPVGEVQAQVRDSGVLVRQIDLSYAVVHWSWYIDEGRALRHKFGDKVGYYWYPSELTGIFWSNDPAMSIGQMLGSLGFMEMRAEIERTRVAQDKARSGPPRLPAGHP